MFALIMSVLPLLPKLIETGIATVDAFAKIRTLIAEDRSLTPEERNQLEAAIAQREAVLNDTTRDVPQ